MRSSPLHVGFCLIKPRFTLPHAYLIGIISIQSAVVHRDTDFQCPLLIPSPVTLFFQVSLHGASQALVMTFMSHSLQSTLSLRGAPWLVSTMRTL